MADNNAQLTYLVPRETASYLRSDVIMSRCQNMNLILARYVPLEVIRNDKIGRFDKWRDRWLKDTCRRFDSNQRADWQQLAEAGYMRWRAMTDTPDVTSFEGQLEDHMMVGLGGESVLETSLTLGHIDGLPVIPGSALKGIARSYALFVIAAQLTVPVLVGDALIDYLRKEQSVRTPLDTLDDLLALPYTTKEEKKAWDKLFKELNENPYMPSQIEADAIHSNENAQIFRLAFGSQAQAGVCNFYDAIVSNLPDGQLFVTDVMTPHYPDYYGSDGTTPPSDDQGPVPIQFMGVARGTTFAFAFRIVSRRLAHDAALRDTINKKVTRWFKRGLRDLGAGAKTHAGYGLFRILKQ